MLITSINLSLFYLQYLKKLKYCKTKKSSSLQYNRKKNTKLLEIYHSSSADSDGPAGSSPSSCSEIALDGPA